MSTKYLSSFIDGFPSGPFRAEAPDRFTPQPFASDVQAEELKQILLDAKEGLEVKNTTHDFYETLERITNELRGMTEHSTAFLSRVRKSDAPDYFNIIKNPMDLGTVLKKVKAQQYKDKSAFKADLDLIWDNCLLYNTLPNHPLRRSAMTLRSRANHLLEFVTDPIASTPAPQVIHSQTASRFDKPGSRLDALDASHTIISTANLIGEPKGAPETEKRHISPTGMDYRQETSLLKQEEREGSSFYEEDFQDEEDDESIRTRKGLTSHKSQPGGGRNLDLLKGLAAQDPSAIPSPQPDDAMSIYPSGLDAEASPSRSPADGSLATHGASIPEVPGTYPGQGSALVARRATGGAHFARDQHIRTRTPSITPMPRAIPLAQRPALRRTPDLMGKFATLGEAGDEPIPVDHLHYPSQAAASTSCLPGLISVALAEDFSGHAGKANGPTSKLALHTSPSASSTHLQDSDAGLEWWQMVCSDDLLANGLPDVPAVPCQRRNTGERRTAGQATHDRKPMNPYWDDLVKLRKIKATHHKLAVLRRDAPAISTCSHLDDGDSDEEEDESIVGQRTTTSTKSRRRVLQHLASSDAESVTGVHGQLTLQIFSTTLLEHAGFDRVEQTALDNISNLLAQYLLSLGSAAAFHRDRPTKKTSPSYIINSALRDVAADGAFPAGRGPLAVLAQYRDVDMPEQSRELSSLSARLDKAYEHGIEEAQHVEPRLKLEVDIYEIESLAGEEAGSSDEAECKSSYALLRMLLEAESDHLGLDELQIPNDTGFPLHLLYASLLRQAFPSYSGDLTKPFEPVPAFVSLVPLSDADTRSEALQSTIGLLQPFLQARSSSAYDLFDDENLPLSVQMDVQKALTTRPDVPYTTGRVVLGKRKREAAPAPTASATTLGVGLSLSTGSTLPGGTQIRSNQSTEKSKKIKAV